MGMLVETNNGHLPINGVDHKRFVLAGLEAAGPLWEQYIAKWQRSQSKDLLGPIPPFVRSIYRLRSLPGIDGRATNLRLSKILGASEEDIQFGYASILDHLEKVKNTGEEKWATLSNTARLRQVEEGDSDGIFLAQCGRFPVLSAHQEKTLCEFLGNERWLKKLSTHDLSPELEAKRVNLYWRGSVAGLRRNMQFINQISSQQKYKFVTAFMESNSIEQFFVLCNLRLVVSIAGGINGLTLLDRCTEGMFGLFKAVEKYDCQLGNKFSTYATWWIRQAITRAVADQNKVIRLPVHMVERIYNIHRTSQRLEVEKGEATPEQIAAETGWSVAQVETALRASMYTDSLDREIAPSGYGDKHGDDVITVGDSIMDDPDALQEEVGRILLEEEVAVLVNQLSLRGQQVLTLRFGLDGEGARTLEEVGRVMGITRERVRQLQQDALVELRRIAFQPTNCERLREYL